jgi:hypothetical protein
MELLWTIELRLRCRPELEEQVAEALGLTGRYARDRWRWHPPACMVALELAEVVAAFDRLGAKAMLTVTAPGGAQRYRGSLANLDPEQLCRT